MQVSQHARFAAWSVTAVVAATLLASPSSAQALYGSLTGNVTDCSGSAVPSGKVEAHSVPGNPQPPMATQANGMPQSSNKTKLDGATISHPWLPRLVAYLPPVEAVETVNVVSNSFDAEQGMAGGAAMNVTIKSGTNSFHGAGWEFLTNSALKARNYFYCLYSCTGDPNRAPKNVQNQFGGMFGGPIIKNKLFFFGHWD